MCLLHTLIGFCLFPAISSSCFHHLWVRGAQLKPVITTAAESCEVGAQSLELVASLVLPLGPPRGTLLHRLPACFPSVSSLPVVVLPFGTESRGSRCTLVCFYLVDLLAVGLRYSYLSFILTCLPFSGCGFFVICVH